MSVLPTIQTNHPALEQGTNAVKYEVFNAPLFTPGKGPVYSDVHQGEYMGDCWLLATLADAAYKNPQLIRNMFTSYGAYNESGVTVQIYGVNFFNARGQKTTVIVDNEFPATSFSRCGIRRCLQRHLGGTCRESLCHRSYSRYHSRQRRF